MSATFEIFFKDNYREVEQRVRSAGASPDTAGEATQEAFTRAYQRWWRLSHYNNPAAWVQKVALNHRIDLERRTNRQTRLITTLQVEASPEPSTDSRVDAAVAALPPQQHAAVQAFYNEGLSTAEAAEQMGITSGAVRFHLNQARTRLRPMLATDTPNQEA
ncbi:MAG: RNA polymerase sigma factor [Acidimicrobiales bacterium]